MSERHPDIFNPDEAAEYLHLPSKETLRTLKEKNMLIGYPNITTFTIYYREDLDRCALRMCGRDPDVGKVTQMRLQVEGR